MSRRCTKCCHETRKEACDFEERALQNELDQSIALDYLVEDKGVVQIEVYNLYGFRLSLDRIDNVQVGAHKHTIECRVAYNQACIPFQ